MNNHRNILLLLPVLLTFLACEPKESTLSPGEKSLERKQLPFDMSSFQRSYPDKTFNVAAYKNAFSEAIVQTAEKSNAAPDGFDSEWTVQGPGNAGARINSIEIDPNDDDVIYLGYGGGGVFKTTNDGLSWTSIFDDQSYLSIGAIEVDPNNSDIVYVGTGDPNITGYPFIGNGIYKSLDAGATWIQSGLTNTGIVSKIIVDPTNSQIIYAATMGNPFEMGDDRGLYKSTNGGASWTKVLFISNQAGVIDMAINPDSPNIIYATGWDRIRSNTQSIAHGNGGRVYRSEDSGSSWEILDNGLPIKELSRSSIDISENDPDVLYVSIVDSTYVPKGIYKTIDGGDSWTAVTEGNSDNGLNAPLSTFGWYFGRIFINPSSDNTIYLLGVRLWRSLNSGDSWFVYPPSGTTQPHVDNHYMAFNSQGDLYLATDGGLYKNSAGTSDFTDIEDIPATQVYRVGYNPHQTDTYYGGTQDNGTQAGNATDGIENWTRVFGADGFQPVFHPTNPQTIYYETQNGNIWRATDGTSFSVLNSGISNLDRRHWDMQYIMSAHNPDILYTGTYKMYRHNPNTDIWDNISGDLTDGIIYGANFHTITTVHESPVDADILYSGTTDGNVWRSLDYGSTWEDITAGLPDRYVTCVKADPNDANGVYVSHSGYRLNEYIPHIHYSSDNGTTWTDISGNLPPLAVNHIEVMPNNYGNVIFAATDAGVYATLNGGLNWDRLGADFPYIQVYDLDLNIANNELIAGTFGRSILTFPLDSIDVSLNPPAIASILGNIETVLGEGVDSVEVSLESNTTSTKLTNIDGNYDFNGIPTGGNVLVRPVKNNKHGNGTTSFDLVLMKRHILQIDTLSPYNLIASDINNSGGLSSFDLVLLTKVILLIDTVFEHNDSWRFIRSDYVFPDTLDPFPFPDTIEYNPISGNQLNADFIAVKIGDVNNTSDPSMLLSADSRTFDGVFDLSITDQIFQKGDRLRIPVRAKNFDQLLGYQFAMNFDPRYLEFQSVEKAALAEIGSQDFGNTVIDKGILATNWTNAVSVTLPEETTLFYVNFEAKEDGTLSELIKLDNDYLQHEAYQGLTSLLDVSLNWNPLIPIIEEVASKEFLLHQNSPNPFRKGEITNIIVSFPVDTEGHFQLYSPTGEVIWSKKDNFQKGTQQIELPASLFSQSGIYFYQLKTKDGYQSTKRMLYLN